jgi:acyl carrier protein
LEKELTEQQIYEHLVSIFREVFDDDELVPNPEMSAKDVAEWDSLNHIRLIVTIERAFKVQFATAEVSSFQNVGHLVQAIQAKVLASSR